MILDSCKDRPQNRKRCFRSEVEPQFDISTPQAQERPMRGRTPLSRRKIGKFTDIP
jgi:hypothetical protein